MPVVSPFQGLVFVILFTQGDAAPAGVREGASDPGGVEGCSHGWRVSAQRDAEPVGMGLFRFARPGGATDASCLACIHNSLLRAHDVVFEARYVFD